MRFISGLLHTPTSNGGGWAYHLGAVDGAGWSPGTGAVVRTLCGRVGRMFGVPSLFEQAGRVDCRTCVRAQKARP